MPAPLTFLVDNGSLEPAATLGLRSLAAQLTSVLGTSVEPVSLLHSSGIEPDRPAIARNLERSLMLVTALVPVLGYDRTAEVAKTAHARDITLREAAVEVLGVMPGEQYDALVRPELMITPRERA